MRGKHGINFLFGGHREWPALDKWFPQRLGLKNNEMRFCISGNDQILRLNLGLES